MSERTGAQQLSLLRQLRAGTATTTELSRSLASVPSTRRSLALLRNRGLVSHLGYAVNEKGRPARWAITAAGIDFLATRNRGKS